MSIRFSLSFLSADIDTPLRIDAHHIASDGSWFEHPIRSHDLRAGHTLRLLAHVALGFVLQRCKLADVCLAVSHDDAQAAHGLELVVMRPGAEVGAELGADGEAVECERLVFAPGASGQIALPLGTQLQLREVRMPEGGAGHG